MMIKETVHLEDTTLLNEDSLLIEGGTRKQTSLPISGGTGKGISRIQKP